MPLVRGRAVFLHSLFLALHETLLWKAAKHLEIGELDKRFISGVREGG